MRATKSRKQVTQNCDANFKDIVETPFSIGLSLLVHKETRNKKMIHYLSDLGLSISYKKVIKIENGLGNAIIEKKKSNDGVYIPESIIRNSCLHFAIDNIDFRNDTADGKNEFHGTTQVVFQKKQELEVADIQITPTNCLKYASDPIHACMKPKQPNDNYENYNDPSSLINISTFVNKDRLWGMLQITNSLELFQLPTWGAFNSLMTKTPSISVCETLPLSYMSPTD